MRTKIAPPTNNNDMIEAVKEKMKREKRLPWLHGIKLWTRSIRADDLFRIARPRVVSTNRVIYEIYANRVA